MAGDSPRIENISPDALTPHQSNARTHSADQIDQIKRSIAEFGFTNPVLISPANMIVAGHGRVRTAEALGWTRVPCLRLDHLSETQIRAYVIADNQLALSAGWDEDLLALELGALSDANFDQTLTGFSQAEINELVLGDVDQADADDPIDEDDAPAPFEVPVVKPGEVYALGEHRLICGDSGGASSLAKLMGPARADFLFMSPPYGQQRDYGAAHAQTRDWDQLMQRVFAAAPVKDSAQLLVNLGLIHRDGEWQPYWEDWIAWMREAGWRRFGWYVWDQGPQLPGNWAGRLGPSHEFVFHFNRQATTLNKTVESKHGGEILSGNSLRKANGELVPKSHAGRVSATHRVADSVLRVMRHKGGLGKAGSHPAVFPVALVEQVLEIFTQPGDVVFEPFAGSGTQIVAAEKTQRQCRASELDPAYCDVAIRRWQAFTGQDAIRESDGQTFDELMNAVESMER